MPERTTRPNDSEPATGEPARGFVQYWIADPAMGALKYALYHLYRLFPIDRCSSIAKLIVPFVRRTYPESEARARRLWQRLNPDRASDAECDAAMTRLWHNVVRTHVEFPILDRLWKAGRISVEGVEHLDSARAAGKPRLIACMHLGNWEAICIALIENGHPGSGIYLPPENRFEHRLLRHIRAQYGARFVAAGPHSGREALKELKANKEVFAIFVDEFIRGRVHAPMFGRPLKAEGNIAYVARLAAMTNAAVIPAYCERIDGRANFKVRFLPAVAIKTGGPKDTDLLENITRIDAAIAPAIAAHVDQWFYALDFDFDR